MPNEKETSVIKEALEQIYEDHGELVPEDVVEAARPRNHPLHECFEWNDTEAGKQYRIQQARRLIMRVRIEWVSPEGETKSVRAYASKFQAGKVPPGYHRIDTDFDSEMDRAYLLRSMEREWKSFRARWEHLAEFWGMINRDVPAPAPARRTRKKAS